MLLAQLSDLHIKAGRRKAYGVVDTAAMLEAAVAHLLALDPPPDAVLITGDLADHGSPQDYALLREVLAPLLARQAQMPLYLMLGNHDDAQELRDAFPEHRYLWQDPEFVHFSLNLAPDLRLLALDTVEPGRSGGRLCAKRMAWLQTQLQADPRPTLLAMHHPPFATGIAHMDRIGLADTQAFCALLAQHPQVERIVCGHLHRTISVRLGLTVASTCPSPAHQVALDLRPQGPDCFVMEPAGYQLHRWAGRQLVSHNVVLGSYAGPYRFRDGGALID